MLNKPLESLATCKDLGRLSKRIDIIIKNDESVSNFEGIDVEISNDVNGLQYNDPASDHEAETDPTATSDLSFAKCLANVLDKLITKLEDPASHKFLLDAVNMFELDCGDNPDLQEQISKLLSLFDQNSPTVRLLKMVNQSALAIAVGHLKLHMMAYKTSLKPEIFMTKDVRTSDGWRIEIMINNITGEVTVSHVRKEQTLGQPFCPSYWDMQWRVDMLFDKKIRSLQTVELKIIAMNFDSNFPNEIKNEIENAFFYGKIFPKEKPTYVVTMGPPVTGGETNAINSCGSLLNDIRSCIIL
jgi:hypothetical protein